MKCKYADLAQCKETNCLKPFKSCAVFQNYWMRELSRNIRPFKFNSSNKTSERVCFSRDENKIKSMALNRAIEEKAAITKFSASQCIHLLMWDDVNQSIHNLTKVVYIDYSSQVYNDDKNILKSIGNFCEAVALDDTSVFIYVKKGLPFLKEIKEV